MTLSTVRIEKKGRVAILRMDKGRGNAIDAPLVEDLIEASGQLSADDGVGAVLLASAHPKLFSPGLDLVGLMAYDRPAMERFMRRFAEMVWALYELKKPLVAAVGGHAIAGGCVLALTAEYRILKRGGFNIGLNEVRVGLPLPWSVALLLRSSIRPERLCEAGLLGRNFADEEALSAGLVQELAPAEGFEDLCLSRIEEFAEKDPVAYATTKAYLRSATVAEMKGNEQGLMRDFMTSWFSDATRARIRATIEALGKPRA